MKPQTFIIAAKESDTMRSGVSQRILDLDPNKPWKVTIEPLKKKRSLDQNALFWRWCTIIGNEIGDDKQAVHDAVVPMLAEPTHHYEVDGRCIPQWNTSRMKKDEMSKLLDALRKWAFSFHGIALPLPEEMHLERQP